MLFRLLPGLVAAALLLATLAIAHHLAALDSASAEEIDLLLAGDLHALYGDARTWAMVPQAMVTTWYLPSLLGAGVLVAMAALLYGVRLGAHRCRWSATATAWACLASAGVPWAICRIAVRHAAEPHEVGPWLADMLGALLIACVACIAVVARSLLRRGAPQPHAVPVAAH